METNAAEHSRWNDDAWTRAWPKREALTDSVTPLLLDALALQPGERVLDIGCGGGKATMAAGRQVQPGGTIVGADISEQLLALAAKRAAGQDNVSFTRVDMQTDAVGHGGFDVVMSQFGVMFFDEPVVAFTNIASHIRPAGRIGFVCWQALDRNPWFVGPTVAPFVPTPAPPGPGKSPTGPFTFGDPDRVRQILENSRFTDVGIAPHSHDVEVPETAVIDDAQLGFMGVAADKLSDARDAVALHMGQFPGDAEARRLPLAFQVVTARTTG